MPAKRDASKKRSDWRICDVAPRKVTRVVERSELNAMESVASAGEHAHHYGCESNVDQDCDVARPNQSGFGIGESAAGALIVMRINDE